MAKSVSADDVESALDAEDADSEGYADTDADAESGLTAEAESRESSSIELSAEDVDAYAKLNHSHIEPEQVGSHRFVKFKDILPPCPPRGVFDVRRIKDSAYFFS